MLNRSLFFIILILLFTGSFGIVIADDMRNTYSLFDKRTANEWRKEMRNYGYGSHWWSINTFLDDPVYNFQEDFFMPIEEWEYMVCSRSLSTQLKDSNQVVAKGGGIYEGNESITVAAYRRVSMMNDSFLYEVTWFIQPSGEKGYMYTIDAIARNGDELPIQEEKGAGQRTGDSGYKAFYAEVNYTSIVLKYLDKSLTYPIIEVTDERRRT